MIRFQISTALLPLSDRSEIGPFNLPHLCVAQRQAYFTVRGLKNSGILRWAAAYSGIRGAYTGVMGPGAEFVIHQLSGHPLLIYLPQGDIFL